MSVRPYAQPFTQWDPSDTSSSTLENLKSKCIWSPPTFVTDIFRLARRNFPSTHRESILDLRGRRMKWMQCINCKINECNSGTVNFSDESKKGKEEEKKGGSTSTSAVVAHVRLTHTPLKTVHFMARSLENTNRKPHAGSRIHYAWSAWPGCRKWPKRQHCRRRLYFISIR